MKRRLLSWLITKSESLVNLKIGYLHVFVVYNNLVLYVSSEAIGVYLHTVLSETHVFLQILSEDIMVA